MSYYRLKQTDFDGKVSYSEVKRIVFEAVRSLVAHPNPTTGTFTVKASFALHGDYMRLLDIHGRALSINVSVDEQNDETTIDPGNIPPGIYILQVSDGVTVESLKVVKQ